MSGKVPTRVIESLEEIGQEVLIGISQEPESIPVDVGDLARVSP